MNFKDSLIITIYYVLVLTVEETAIETGPQGDTNEKQSFVSRNKERFKQGLGNLSTKSKENFIKLKNKAAENLSIYNKKLKELTGKAKEDMIKKREETMKKIEQYNKKLKEFGGRTKENIKKFGTKVFGKSGKKQAENKTKQENEEPEYLEPIQQSKKEESKPEGGSQQPEYLETIPEEEEEEEENIYEEIGEPIYQNAGQENYQNENQPTYGNISPAQ